jgi:hypothetical protein
MPAGSAGFEAWENMAMFARSGLQLALAAILMMATTAVTADAGDRQHRFKKPPPVVVKIVLKHRHRHAHRQVNTYSGDVAIYHRRNVGTWSYGTLPTVVDERAAPPRAKIIHVDRMGGKTDCSMEKGVCVIRP